MTPVPSLISVHH